jgi:hypothetical protein
MHHSTLPGPLMRGSYHLMQRQADKPMNKLIRKRGFGYRIRNGTRTVRRKDGNVTFRIKTDANPQTFIVDEGKRTVTVLTRDPRYSSLNRHIVGEHFPQMTVAQIPEFSSATAHRSFLRRVFSDIKIRGTETVKGLRTTYRTRVLTSTL